MAGVASSPRRAIDQPAAAAMPAMAAVLDLDVHGAPSPIPDQPGELLGRNRAGSGNDHRHRAAAIVDAGGHIDRVAGGVPLQECSMHGSFEAPLFDDIERLLRQRNSDDHQCRRGEDEAKRSKHRGQHAERREPCEGGTQ